MDLHAAGRSTGKAYWAVLCGRLCFAERVAIGLVGQAAVRSRSCVVEETKLRAISLQQLERLAVLVKAVLDRMDDYQVGCRLECLQRGKWYPGILQDLAQDDSSGDGRYTVKCGTETVHTVEVRPLKGEDYGWMIVDTFGDKLLRIDWKSINMYLACQVMPALVAALHSLPAALCPGTTSMPISQSR